MPARGSSCLGAKAARLPTTSEQREGTLSIYGILLEILNANRKVCIVTNERLL